MVKILARAALVLLVIVGFPFHMVMSFIAELLKRIEPHTGD